MDYLMVRTFDHAGYYETRLILTIITLGIAVYQYQVRGDRRFAVVFASGALLMIVTEFVLLFNGLRGAGFSFSIFGLTVHGIAGPILRGALEGGACGLLAFWFADLRSLRAGRRKWMPFWVVSLVALGLSIAVGRLAQDQAISSVRRMFSTEMVFYVTTIIFISLLIAWRRDAIGDFANFFGGLLFYTLIVYVPLQIFGVRYIGIMTDAQVQPASAPVQITLMLLSHIYEIAGARIHFFMIPVLLGLVRLLEKKSMESGERYSTQHLLDLAQRGWRKRSKPFQKDRS